MKDQAPSLSPTGLRPAPPGLPPHPSHSFRYLLSVKHTRDLLQLSPYHTQRALTEIEHSDMLNRFYAAAEDLGLYRERYRSLVTIEELDSVIRRVRSALQVIVWDAKRLSMTCRWLLRSVRKLQRFTRAHLSRLRDLKSKVAVMLTTAVQAAWQSLNVETREHTRRYRMPQQQVFVAEAYELLVDCHLDSDTVRNVVDSVWLHRKQMYHRRFSELQRGQKQDELKRLEDIQTLVRGVDPTDLENNAAVEFAAQAIASAGHSIMGRKDSMLTMRTLTFRRLRLLRVDFETPLLQFGPEHVTLAELCAHLRIMKARTVQQSIDKYFANQQHEGGDVTADATSDEQANKSMPVVQRLSPAEALLVEQMLETSKQTRGPVSYFHALISLDCRTDWFTLYCLRRLNRGIVDVIPSVGAPEAMVAQYHVAERIARSWGKLPGTAAAASHTTSSGGTSSKALKEKHSRPSSAPHQRPADNGADRRYSLASDGQPKARCGFVALAGEPVRRAERTSPDGSSRRHGLSPRGASSTRVSPTKSPPPHRAPQDRISPTALEPSGAETEVHKRQHQGTMSATTSPRSTRPLSFSSARDRYGTTYTSTSSASAQELWLDVLASHRDAIAKVKNQISARYISRENVVTTAALRQEHAADVATLERRIKYQGQQRKANHKPSDIKLWMQSWMSLPQTQHVTTKENTTMPQPYHTSIPTSTSIGVEPNTPLEGLLASRRVVGSFKEPSATAAAGLPSRPTSAGVTRGQRPIPSTGGLLPPKGAAISLVIAPSSFRPKRTQ